MASRYFVETPVVGDSAVLTEGEAHHVARVMRAGVGDCLVLFDGSGWEYEAEIKRIAKHAVELAIVSRREMDRELPLAIHLGVALPKGDRQAWLVEKAVELGVARLTPLETERSVAQPSDKALVRLRRGVIEASKQCGRNRLMQIEEPQRWSSFIGQPASAGAQLQALESPPPTYPPEAVRDGASGTVLLEILVGIDGRALEVRVVRSSGHRALDQAARRVVLSRWRFQPAQRNGHAVQAIGRVPIDFVLQR